VLLFLLLDGTNRSFVASKKTESFKTFTGAHRQSFLCLQSGNLKSFSIIYSMCNCLSEKLKHKVVKQLMNMAKHWKRRKRQCNNIVFLTIKGGQSGFMMDKHHVNTTTHYWHQSPWHLYTHMALFHGEMLQEQELFVPQKWAIWIINRLRYTEILLIETSNLINLLNRILGWN
jgi:hypothetical protein